MSDISICMKESLNNEEIKKIESLNKICSKRDEIYIKLELDYKMNNFKVYKSNSRDNLNEFLYYFGDDLVGYLGICSFTGNTGELTGMVHPCYRRKGIFKRLFNMAFDECKKRNFEKILLVCDRKGKEGLEFIKSTGANYSFSEFEMKHEIMDYFIATEIDEVIDLSHTIEEDMPVYPGDVKTSLFQNKYLKVNEHNNHRLEINMHAGTHIDSPMHLTESTQYISEISLNRFIGEGCILDVRNNNVITLKEEYKSIIRENSVVLLYTGYDKLYGTKSYYDNHPVIDVELCDFLIKKKVKMIGMDMPSPDRYPFNVHKALLANNIYIIENLTNLHKLIKEIKFEIIALPLKIKADGSMARIAARIINHINE